MQSPAELRLICVDDERGALINCKSAIQTYPDGVSATFFELATEAIESVKQSPIDIAFLDIDMPEMSGFTLAERLKQLCPMMEIVFVTANIDYMSLSNRKVKGLYIFKPYLDSEITDVLKRLALRLER